MNRYIAYGLRIHSDLPLPELVPAEGNAAPDVVIRLQSLDPDREEMDEPDTAYFSWEEVGRFEARRGKHVIADLNDNVDPDIARLPLLGLVLGAILLQRGFLVLHASAVVVDDGVVAFLGHKGYGKSTTAAALHAQGHPLIADDLLAVHVPQDGSTPLVWPGFPVLKLWPESVSPATGTGAEAWPTLHERVEKRLCTLPPEVAPDTPIPLRRLFVLKRGDQLAIEPLAPSKAFITLHSFSYHLPDLRERLQTADRAATPVAQYGEVVSHVPVRHLVRPADLSALPEMANRIVDEIRGGSSCEKPPEKTVAE
ncbi:hypothetical protein CRI94_12570 [Longibacter salinarum]|uniref:Serine kinase n=1 Tax=Longibacter salinarum TaxID=1850348 RepID=A0A2A8CVX0_9BACT|nr:hypothetical protein [Longibacter salinarum]PEN12832.1 hypothetical protein CRI94_12570 [Longibacter salinarum]